jgi:hypothetical protein
MRSSRETTIAGAARVSALPAAIGLAHAVATAVLAASPSPTAAAAAGDPRSSGQGPGLVGDPLWAIAIVAVIGITALVATLAYVRTTRGRDDLAGR